MTAASVVWEGAAGCCGQSCHCPAPDLLQTLYESSLAFGVRKALQAEVGKSELEARCEALETSTADLQRQVTAWLPMHCKHQRLMSARACLDR